MKKKKFNARELYDQYQVNVDRINEIADTCETESRERNEAEETEFLRLTRENQLLQMRMQSLNLPKEDTPAPGLTEQVREALTNGRTREIKLQLQQRDVSLMTTSGLADTGIIPVDQQEMLKPLRSGLIYDLVGLNVRTGLAKGQLRWPTHGKATAAWADEGERAGDSNIDFSKLTLTPVRLTIAIPVTREELDSSEGVVEGVIREEMPAAVIDKINEAMFATEKTFKVGETTKNRKVYGPLPDAAVIEFDADTPTRKELLKMKSKVASSGIKLAYACWVMTENMKAELEDLKVDSGSGRFVCENDRIFGYPVFTTPFIGDGNIAFGEWSYQAAGFFGNTEVVVDPYTLLRQNSTDFVLNAHFGTTTLYKEAFVLGHKKVTTQAGK